MRRSDQDGPDYTEAPDGPDGGDPNRPAWLPPGATLNPDGSVTMANGTVVPGPPPGYARDPNTGVIAYTGEGGSPMTPGIEHAGPVTDPGGEAVTVNPLLASTYAPGTGGTPAAPAGGPAAPGGGGPPAGYQTINGDANDFPAFDEPWNKPTDTGLPDAPVFAAPEDKKPDPFHYDDYKGPDPFSFANFVAPDPSAMNNDPYFKFRTEQGRNLLEHGAAARGVLATGMSLKDVLDYGQQAASQEGQNIFGRAADVYRTNRANAFDNYNTNAANGLAAYNTNRNLATDTYNTNYQTQYVNPYNNAYKAAVDKFNGLEDQYKTNAGFIERGNEFNTNTSFNKWQADYQHYVDEQRDRWNRIYGAATA